jgi:hypothetical protein
VTLVKQNVQMFRLRPLILERYGCELSKYLSRRHNFIYGIENQLLRMH